MTADIVQTAKERDQERQRAAIAARIKFGRLPAWRRALVRVFLPRRWPG